MSKNTDKTAKNDAISAGYSAKNISVLEGLEPVRKRPGMYIGSTGVDGLHHLIWEVVDNSIDEAMAGHAKNIRVEIMKGNRVAVTDDGRGIPVDIHPQTKKSALETVMCTLHAGGKFDSESYKVSGGLHGVGVSVVCALSTWSRAEVCRDGGLYVQEYKKGVPQKKVEKIGKCNRRGTKIMFDPDPTIFTDTTEFDLKRIFEHLRQQTYLTQGVRIEVIDYRKESPLYYGFYFESGVRAFIRHLTVKDCLIQEELFYVHKQSGAIDVEAAILYSDDSGTREMSFANNIYTPDGGSHLTGFRSALTRAINDLARDKGYVKEADDNLTGDDVREGLSAIISIKLPEPQFEGQTKARLGTPIARTAVEAVVAEALKEFLEKHPSEARAIAEKCILVQKARKAAKAAKETVLRKGAFEGMTLPGKLADCSSRNSEETELFIVEGDSAGGSSKMARDRRTQAILPLRGKIMNVEKSRIDKMLINNEIKSLVIALGTAIGENYNQEKLRYNKIIIMTDADTDGAHIRTLLLTLFYRHFRPLVMSGHIFIAEPPLYRVQSGKDVRYAYNDAAKDKIVAEISRAKSEKSGKTVEVAVVEGEEGKEDTGSTKGINIQRYKGLGEMNPDQLWETTLDPEKRMLKVVTVDNAEEADKLFDILMGEVVEPRKNFILDSAATVKNLDI